MPPRPLAQKAQPIAQPTCVEKQTIVFSGRSTRTTSAAVPGATATRYLVAIPLWVSFRIMPLRASP